jgi:hypothetical protein
MLAVSTVFMTQSIFLELSEFFKIHITQARFSFSIVSLFYAVAFIFLGPAADKFDLPKNFFNRAYFAVYYGFLLILCGKFSFVHSRHGFDWNFCGINSGINVPTHCEDFSQK